MIGGPVGFELTVGVALGGIIGAFVLVVGVTEGDNVGAVGFRVGDSDGFGVGSLVGWVVISDALHPMPP